MCCFSIVTPFGWLGRLLWPRPLTVGGTRIFARSLGREQGLVYALDLSVARDVAMILPLPVDPAAGEDGLTFVDLSGYSEFFTDLEAWCAPPVEALPKRGGISLPRPRLQVHQVGAYEASFVPTLADMDRLDPRFRIPDAAWQALPAVQDFGFAVFKLPAGRRRRVHPMALRFRTREPGRLFFPTVHIHDGQVHPTAEFRHSLYWQGAAGDEQSPAPAGAYVQAERCAGLVDGGARISRRVLRGELPNVDTWVSLGTGAA